MLRKFAGLLVVTILVALVFVPNAASQTEATQPVVYTYVSQFQVPRANWSQFAENTEKSFVPIADKLVADGTILSYSTFETIVHTPDGYTHGSAWSSTSIAGLMKVLDEVRKAGPQPGQIAATKHEDYLMQSTMYKAGGTGAPAYLRVVCQNAKPDNPEEYTAALKKYLWPTMEEQFKQGVVNYIGIDSQYVNVMAPSTRCLVINFPSADSMDKWAAAIRATLSKFSPADRAAFFGSTVADSRRDFMARITHSKHK